MLERKPLLIASLFLNYFVFAILLNSVGSVILQVQNSFSVSASEASVLEAYKDLSIAITSFLVASFVAQLGYKRAMLIALSLVFLVLAAMPQIPAFWMNKLLFMATGIGFAVIKVSIFATLGLLTNSTRQHASLMSFLEAFFMLGVLSGYFLFGAYVDDSEAGNLGWYQVYYPLAGLALVALLTLALTSFDQPKDEAVESASSLQGFKDMLTLCLKPLVLVFVLSVFLYVLIEQGIMSWLPTFNNVVLNLPASLSIQMASIMAASIAIGRFLAGYLSQRINWYPLLCVCLILAGLLVLAAMPMAQSVDPQQVVSNWFQAPLAAYIFPLIGLCLAPVYPIINSVVLSSLPQHQHAPMTGLIVVFSALGGTLGSLITGSLFELFDGATAFYCSLLPMVGILVTLTLLKRQSVKPAFEQVTASSAEQGTTSALFHAVQTKHIFADSKTFVDAVPKSDPNEIELAYLQGKDEPHFDLKQFVLDNYDVPDEASPEIKRVKAENLRAHLDAMWAELERAPDNPEGRSSLIPLPKPYLVPGGRFQEIYYWDSYFTMLGYVLDRGPEMLQNMVENFAHLSRTVGHIPNGNRTYFESRSQPPVLSLMLELLCEYRGVKQVLPKHLAALESEHAFWMRGVNHLTEDGDSTNRVVKVGDGYLNRYWDTMTTPRPESYAEDVALASACARSSEGLYRDIRAACESGWDFSTRWLDCSAQLEGIETTAVIPVDLNVLMYLLESTLAKAYTASGRLDAAESMRRQADQRRALILTHFYDEDRGFFVDLNLADLSPRPTLSLAGLYPLYAGIATPEQADRVQHRVHAEFLREGGWVTTLSSSGQQWDAPNGWAPLQWITYQALMNYGFHAQATTGAERWIDNNQRVYDETGCLFEKYNVETIGHLAGGGEYVVQHGFGWTNGVLVKLKQVLEPKTRN